MFYSVFYKHSFQLAIVGSNPSARGSIILCYFASCCPARAIGMRQFSHFLVDGLQKLFFCAITLSALVSALRIPNSLTKLKNMIQKDLSRSAQHQKTASPVISRENSRLMMMEQISKHYDSFIIDQWGVLHDGKTPYTGVIECLTNLKSAGKRLILLSNSSKRKSSSFKGLKKVGIDPELFDDIVTSGELTWHAILGRRFDFEINRNNQAEGASTESLSNFSNSKIDIDSNSNSGSSSSSSNDGKLKVFVIGNNDDDIEYISSCNCIPSPPESADFILARGTFCFYTGPSTTSGSTSTSTISAPFSTSNSNPITFTPPSVSTPTSASSISVSTSVTSTEKVTISVSINCNIDDINGITSYKQAEHLINDVDPYLLQCINRKLPMLVSNPDFYRPGSGAPMPGQIGTKL